MQRIAQIDSSLKALFKAENETSFTHVYFIFLYALEYKTLIFYTLA